jgi:hypothetical protein
MKLTNTHCLLLIFVLTLFLASCNYSPESGKSGVLIPLKTGNQWIYEETVKDSLGNVITSKIDTSNIGLTVAIKGETWYFFTPPGEKSIDAGLFANRFNGLFQLDEQSNAALLEFPYPASVGFEAVLFADTSFFNDIIDRVLVRLVAINEAVDTKKGTFFCYHYQALAEEKIISINQIATSPSLQKEDIYIAPNIGIIKMVEPSDGISFDSTFISSTTRTIQLTDYTLK